MLQTILAFRCLWDHEPWHQPALLGWFKCGAAVRAGCAVRNLQQDSFLPPVWFGPRLQVMGWPLRLFGQGRIFKRLAFIARELKMSWTWALSQSHMLYLWSSHKRLFGKGPSSITIHSRNLQLFLPLCPLIHFLTGLCLPGRLSHALSPVCQSENVLVFLFFK